MTTFDLLTDAFGRIRENVHEATRGLSTEQLTYRPTPDANSIAWLIWHLTRVQDDHINDAAGTKQVWTTSGWAEHFDLPLPTDATGFGHSSAEVAAVTATASNLLGYHDAVYERTVEYLKTLSDDDLSRVIDENWNPPVTLGVRLVSVIGDDMQHAGQAAYVRGLLPR